MMHSLAHLLGWNEGHIESWRDGDRWMMGFRCSCGRLMHAFEHGRDGDNADEEDEPWASPKK